jgi:DNA-binding transcriptional regulator YiaG
MNKVETILKSEIIRLTQREMRKVSIPLGRDVRLLKNAASQLRKAVLALERFAAHQQKEISKREIRLEAPPEEIKKSRFSPRLIRSLRKKLRITQKELAVLAGVTVGAVHQWEVGKFQPKTVKKARLAALRKLTRSDVKKLLEEKGTK